MTVSASRSRFVSDERGGVLVEATIMLTIIFVFVSGAVDFLYGFYQWNAAAKAVEIGARIAAVSDPVATGLNGLPKAVIADAVTCPGTGQPCAIGDQMPSYSVTCTGTSNSAGTCTCTGTCDGVSGYTASAMNALVFGRDNSSCQPPQGPYSIGMCNVFDRVGIANVTITYTQTGLGFAGRSNPVPTITVSLRNLPFQFFFLGSLLGFGNIEIPATVTVTGEDLSSSY
jgi:Flp pilus assembly protein TadG